MVRIISFANQKGGVGKTTTCVNLAASLAETKHRVLLVDLDPQGNATMASGVDKNDAEQTIYDVLVGDADIKAVIQTNETVKYGVLASNINLSGAEVELLELPQREYRLQQALQQVTQDYDYILIDCPPSLNMLTVNAMVASDSILIPMQCEYYALEGLAGLLNTIETLRSNLNPKLHIEGILRTMYDGRARLTQDVSKQLLDHFGEKVYQTVIPRNVRLAEAPSHGVPALLYDQKSQGAAAYLALAGEMKRRHENVTTELDLAEIEVNKEKVEEEVQE